MRPALLTIKSAETQSRSPAKKATPIKIPSINKSIPTAVNNPQDRPVFLFKILEPVSQPF